MTHHLCLVGLEFTNADRINWGEVQVSPMESNMRVQALSTTTSFISDGGSGLDMWHIVTYSTVNMGMDQYLLRPFLMGWTYIYQLFWCSPGVTRFWHTATWECWWFSNCGDQSDQVKLLEVSKHRFRWSILQPWKARRISKQVGWLAKWWN